MLKIWKMAADFPNVYRYYVCLCSSVVLADVLEHNCNPAGENWITFCGRYLCFSFHLSYIVGKIVGADCWFPWRNVDAAAAWKKKLSPSPKRKKQFPSHPIKTPSTRGSSDAMNTRAKRLRMRKDSIFKLPVANANITTRIPVFEQKSNFISIQNFKAGNVKPPGMHWSKDF